LFVCTAVKRILILKTRNSHWWPLWWFELGWTLCIWSRRVWIDIA